MISNNIRSEPIIKEVKKKLLKVRMTREESYTRIKRRPRVKDGSKGWSTHLAYGSPKGQHHKYNRHFTDVARQKDARAIEVRKLAGSFLIGEKIATI